MYVFLSICLVFFLSFNHVTEIRAIVGGSTASEGELPFVVSLQINNMHTCGGSILDETSIITARSCLLGKRKEELTIIAGAINLETREHASIHNIIEIREHSFGISDAADIAILKVRPRFNFNQLKNRVVLPGPKLRVLPDQRVRVSGWGITKDNNGTSKSLNVADVYALRQCDPPFAGDFCTTHKNSNDFNQGVCKGDFGGPVIMDNNILVGIITSSGYTVPFESNHTICGSKKHPDRHVKVAYYLDWIHSFNDLSVTHNWHSCNKKNVNE